MSEEKRETSGFGELIHRERKRMGMTLNSMSDYLGENAESEISITSSYLNRLENGDRDNPTFKLVCGIVRKLGLDLYEVFKSFGYEDLIQSITNNDCDDLGMIIKLAKIKAPIKKLNNGDTLEDYILDEEKEILIEILKKVFDYSITNNDARLNKVITEIIELSGRYREAIMKKSENVRYEKRFHIDDEIFYLYISDHAKEEIEKSYKTIDDIMFELQKLRSELFGLNRYFYLIIDKDRGIVARFERIYNKIKVLDVGKLA